MKTYFIWIGKKANATGWKGGRNLPILIFLYSFFLQPTGMTNVQNMAFYTYIQWIWKAKYFLVCQVFQNMSYQNIAFCFGCDIASHPLFRPCSNNSIKLGKKKLFTKYFYLVLEVEANQIMPSSGNAQTASDSMEPACQHGGSLCCHSNLVTWWHSL